MHRPIPDPRNECGSRGGAEHTERTISAFSAPPRETRCSSGVRGGGGGWRFVRGGVLWTALVACVAACAETPRAQPPAARMAYDEAVRGNVGGAQSFAEESRGIPGFAGVHGRGCDVVVLVTEPTAAIEATARERFARDLPSVDGCEGEVRVERARYAWTQLTGWHQRLELRGAAGVLAHAPNVIRNRVVVAVEDDSAAARVRTAAERAGVPADAVLIAVTGPATMRPPRYMLAVQARLGPEPGGVPGVPAVVLRADGGTVHSGSTDSHGNLVVELERGGEYEVRITATSGYALAPGEPASRRVRVGPMEVEPQPVMFYFVRDSQSVIR
jgi:hypothetical protein